MLVRAHTPGSSTLQDGPADGLEHRVMPVAEDHEVVVSVRSALFAREDVMHVEDGGALSAEEAPATSAIARENARPGVLPRFHCQPRRHVAWTA